MSTHCGTNENRSMGPNDEVRKRICAEIKWLACTTLYNIEQVSRQSNKKMGCLILSVIHLS